MPLTPEQAREAKDILDSDNGNITANEVAKTYGYNTAQGLRIAIGSALQQKKETPKTVIKPEESVSTIVAKAVDNKDRDEALLSLVAGAVKAARVRVITSACAVEIICKAVM